MSASLTVVTGAATGIGAAIASELGDRGHRVIVTDRDVASGSSHAASIGATFRPLDVTNDDAVADLVAALEAELAPIGAWVNNAGISALKPFVDVPMAQLDRILPRPI